MITRKMLTEIIEKLNSIEEISREEIEDWENLIIALYSTTEALERMDFSKKDNFARTKYLGMLMGGFEYQDLHSGNLEIIKHEVSLILDLYIKKLPKATAYFSLRRLDRRSKGW